MWHRAMGVSAREEPQEDFWVGSGARTGDDEIVPGASAERQRRRAGGGAAGALRGVGGLALGRPRRALRRLLAEQARDVGCRRLGERRRAGGGGESGGAAEDAEGAVGREDGDGPGVEGGDGGDGAWAAANGAKWRGGLRREGGGGKWQCGVR